MNTETMGGYCVGISLKYGYFTLTLRMSDFFV